MTIDNFLSFWSQHNTTIIEALFAVVIVFSLFLAYRSFYGKSGDVGATGSSANQNLDSVQLEKTLQKILENQSSLGGARLSDDLSSSEISLDGSLDSIESGAEVTALRSSLAESTQKIEVLQAQLLEAQSNAEAGASVAVSGEAGAEAAAASAAELAGLNTKIKELEERLEEYDIISQDIADLSRSRKENEELRAEIEALKARAGAAPEATATAVVSEPEVIAGIDPEEILAEVAAEATADAEAASDLIDDELMREFAAAVEGQKGLEQAAKKAGDGQQAPVATDDTDKLMDQFENFVTKKS